MLIKPSVKTLIFDFGNVIIDIDFQRTWNAFEILLDKNFTSIYNRWKQDRLYAKFEQDVYTVKEMTTIINSTYNLQLSEDEVKNAWNALLLTIPKERIKLLYKLKENYNLYLLSNTSKIHIDCIFSQLDKDYSKNPIVDVFDKLYLSYEIGLIKPDVKIYEYVLNDLQIEGNECLFFDDLQENLIGAEQLNIQTQLVTKQNSIVHLLTDNR